MSWLENLLILLGISFDIFAIMECEGSVVAKIDKKQLISACCIISLWQAFVLSVGNFLSALLVKKDGIAKNDMFIGNVIAAVIFICLGSRLMAKAVKNESIQERRKDGIKINTYIHMAKVTGFYTLLTGAAFGFMGTSLSDSVIMIIVFSVLVVTGGLYTGYHFGFQQKNKAYIAGAVLLWLAGVDVVVKYIMKLF